MSSSLAGALRLVSVVICLIVVASFALFALSETSSASTRQQETVARGAAGISNPAPGGGVSPPAKRSPESSPRGTLDDVSKALTSPFSAVTAGSTSQWLTRGVNLLLALIVYGFGLGFLARVMRVRL